MMELRLADLHKLEELTVDAKKQSFGSHRSRKNTLFGMPLGRTCGN